MCSPPGRPAMPLSRLRLRLAGRFALSFLAGLTLLNLALFAYLRHRADARVTAQLSASARDLVDAVRDEFTEESSDGPSRLPRGAAAALAEYPPRADAFMVVDSAGKILATRGPASALAMMSPLPPLDRAGTLDRTGPTGTPLRLVVAPSASSPRFAALALESTQSLTEEMTTLAWWLVLSVPLVSLVGFGIGYVFAAGALQPIAALGSDMAGIAPDALGRRLPVGLPPDEIGQLTIQFNELLGRLEAAQARNRSFILRAAHQIRTPLTLLLGESALALERPRDDETYRQALRRIKLAAEQMRHRVEELQLLAQAEAGERPRLTDDVELDGLLLECSDLARARATACGRVLELCQVEPLTVRGHERLLREAVLELIENACRHATADGPIQLSCRADGTQARIEVVSAGPDAGARVRATVPEPESEEHGLAIVRWIAMSHGGTLEHVAAQGRNTFALVIPLA